MNKILETLKGLFGKLPFKNLMEKIPTETRNKIPLLNTLIPLSNYIVSGLILLILISIISGGGNSGLDIGDEGWWVDSRGYYIGLQKEPPDAVLNASQLSMGKWKISDNKLYITYNDDNSTEEFRIKNNTIINSNGIVYKPVPPSTAQPTTTQTVQSSGGGSSQQQERSNQISRIDRDGMYMKVTTITGQTYTYSHPGTTYNVVRIDGDTFYVEYQTDNGPLRRQKYQVRGTIVDLGSY